MELTLQGAAATIVVAAVAGAQGLQPVPLPGAAGPRLQMLGTLPAGHQLLRAAVVATADQPIDAVKAPRFPANTARLTLIVQLNRLPREGMRLHYGLAAAAGIVPLADGVVSFVPLSGAEGTRLEFEIIPKEGRFGAGPYRLTFSMDDAPVLALNFSVG